MLTVAVAAVLMLVGRGPALPGEDGSPTNSIEDRRAAVCVLNIALIQQHAQALAVRSGRPGAAGTLHSQQHRSARLGLFLHGEGVWSQDDVVAFKRALEVRDEIVHRGGRHDVETLDHVVSATAALIATLREARKALPDGYDNNWR